MNNMGIVVNSTAILKMLEIRKERCPSFVTTDNIAASVGIAGNKFVLL